MNWVLGIAVVLGLGGGLFFAVRFLLSPVFLVNLSSLLAEIAAKAILKGAAPRNLTDEEKDRIAEGENPFNGTKFEHEKWLQMQEMKKKANWKGTKK